jgi:16S rRNA processing protein RimM
MVEPITDDPDAIFAPGRRLVVGTTDGEVAPDAQGIHVREARPFKRGLLVHFDEISDRDAADLVRDRYLLAPADELEPLDDGEVYLHDLLGLRVEHTSGDSLGNITAYYELPQGLVVEVQHPRGVVLVPWTMDIVKRVDVEAKLVVVEPPAGLFD